MAKMGKEKQGLIMRNMYNPFTLGLEEDKAGNIIFGPPAKYKTPLELARKIHQYFLFCLDNNERPLIVGMILYLGFADRQSFYDYVERYDIQYVGSKDQNDLMEVNSDFAQSFSYILKRAKSAIEACYERALDNPQTVTGAIFALKQFGWSDSHNVNVNHTSIPKIPQLSPEEIDKITTKVKRKDL